MSRQQTSTTVEYDHERSHYEIMRELSRIRGYIDNLTQIVNHPLYYVDRYDDRFSRMHGGNDRERIDQHNYDEIVKSLFGAPKKENGWDK